MSNLDLLFQASIFGDFKVIGAQPEVIMKLIELFKDDKFIPSINNEVPLSPQMLMPVMGNNMPMPLPPVGIQPIQRPWLVTADNDWVIKIGTNRIDVEKNCLPKKEEPFELKEFIEKTIFYLEKLLKEFKVCGNRLALITSMILMDIDTKDKVYDSLMNSIEFYKDKKPFEWGLRSVGNHVIRISEKDENLNVVTQLDRGTSFVFNVGNNFQQNFEDEISLQIDINTKITPDSKLRFDNSNIKDFFNQAYNLRNSIVEQLGSVINGGE